MKIFFRTIQFSMIIALITIPSIVCSEESDRGSVSESIIGALSDMTLSQAKRNISLSFTRDVRENLCKQEEFNVKDYGSYNEYMSGNTALFVNTCRYVNALIERQIIDEQLINEFKKDLLVNSVLIISSSSKSICDLIGAKRKFLGKSGIASCELDVAKEKIMAEAHPAALPYSIESDTRKAIGKAQRTSDNEEGDIKWVRDRNKNRASKLYYLPVSIEGMTSEKNRFIGDFKALKSRVNKETNSEDFRFSGGVEKYINRIDKIIGKLDLSVTEYGENSEPEPKYGKLIVKELAKMSHELVFYENEVNGQLAELNRGSKELQDVAIRLIESIIKGLSIPSSLKKLIYDGGLYGGEWKYYNKLIEELDLYESISISSIDFNGSKIEFNAIKKGELSYSANSADLDERIKDTYLTKIIVGVIYSSDIDRSKHGFNRLLGYLLKGKECLQECKDAISLILEGSPQKLLNLMAKNIKRHSIVKGKFRNQKYLRADNIARLKMSIGEFFDPKDGDSNINVGVDFDTLNSIKILAKLTNVKNKKSAKDIFDNYLADASSRTARYWHSAFTLGTSLGMATGVTVCNSCEDKSGYIDPSLYMPFGLYWAYGRGGVQLHAFDLGQYTSRSQEEEKSSSLSYRDAFVPGISIFGRTRRYPLSFGLDYTYKPSSSDETFDEHQIKLFLAMDIHLFNLD